MYLRRLELLGFKSFALKTELNFPHGVAAVVGPNGCGKSNVLDAIRWALGEQSAKALRGGEMADVIFNGADSRQPLGMAEVTLTFADCEAQLGTAFNEVAITRRVYRDGRGEYLLNKTACRLRDIHELFMDTGVGRSSYSIMEQGRIDLILSSRPEDRRAVFEEAAGITKYKSQRKEATRKLEQTDGNLTRLTDVVTEVKRQLNSLQRQAGKARRHRALTTDLRLLDTHLAHDLHQRLEHDLAAAKEDLSRLRSAQAHAEDEVNAGEQSLAAARTALERLAARFQEARTTAQECRDRLRAAESRQEFNRERAAESRTLRERYEGEVAGAEERLRAQEEELHAAEEETRQIATLLAAGQERQREQEGVVRDARAKRVAAEAALQQAQQAAAEGERRLGQQRAELANLTQQAQAGDVRRELLAGELARLEPTRAGANERMAEARAETAASQTALEARRADVRAAEEAVTASQKELAAAEQTLAAALKVQAGRTSRLEVLRGLNEAGAGFSAGTQAVLRGLDRPELFKPAMVGVLGASLDVEARFIPAVEAVLGHHLQTVVMRDDEAAAELLATLANGKKVGRATLVNVTARPAGQPGGDGRTPTLPGGALAWARDVVKTPAVVAALADRLLAGAVIVETLEQAAALRREQPELTVATLHGELLHRDGFLEGGQASGESTQQGVLQRRTQIRALEAEAAAGQREIDAKTHARVAAAAGAQAAAAAAAEARGHLQTAQVQASTRQGQLALLEREARELAARADHLAREQAETERRCRAAAEQVDALEKRVRDTAAAIETQQATRAAAAEQVETFRTQENTLSETLNELRLRVATEQQRHEGLRRQRQPMDARRTELAELIVRRQRELDEHGRRLTQYGAEAEALADAIETAGAELAAAEAEIAVRREEHADASSALEALDAALRSQRQALTAWHDRRASQEVREAQLRLRHENLREQTAARYQVDLGGFQPEPAALLDTYQRLVEEPGAAVDWTRVESLAADLRAKLDGLGSVNADAIAEFEALEERYQFLEKQNADLVAARKELLNIIAKINATSRTLFAETFERIRVNFQEMYAELFGGGRANLLLVDEEDPLECGIDIIARPPGKQLQSVTLLSGGEKTMTAVALLFAIFMVKPSPFCVLDEMDAPLDESNIARFLKILDRFVAQSQFIVMTHNKRTMARADVLYGVTMEEAGVSKLVAVRMARRDQEPAVAADLIGTTNPGAAPGAVDESATGTAAHEGHGEPPSVAESFGKRGELQSETAAH